jgi:hypothetical protein
MLKENTILCLEVLLMFELIFGAIWTAVSGFIAVIMYSVDTVEVNGVPVSQDVFREMLWPKLFIGLFLVIGIFMLVKGIVKILTNLRTQALGAETFGFVINIYPNGTYVNNMPMMNADVLLVEDNGNVEQYTESIGRGGKFNVGDYISVKKYANDINIGDRADRYSVPSHIRTCIESDWRSQGLNQDGYTSSGSTEYQGPERYADTVIINGVEYVRKNK